MAVEKKKWIYLPSPWKKYILLYYFNFFEEILLQIQIGVFFLTCTIQGQVGVDLGIHLHPPQLRPISDISRHCHSAAGS